MNITQALELVLELNPKKEKPIKSAINQFKKYGNLRSAHYKKLLNEELNRFYTSVEITGYGKKGVVTLGDKRKEPLKEIVDKRVNNGHKATELDKLFANQLSAQITQVLHNRPKDFHWAFLMFARDSGIENILNIDDSIMKCIIDDLKELFGDDLLQHTTKNTLKYELINTYREHIKSITESALSLLETNELIKLQRSYTITNGENTYIQISDKEYKDFLAMEDMLLRILKHEKWFLLKYRYSNIIPKISYTGRSLAVDYVIYKNVLESIFKGHIVFRTFRPMVINQRLLPKEPVDIRDLHLSSFELFIERTLTKRLPQLKDSYVFNKRYFHIIMFLWIKHKLPKLYKSHKEDIDKYISEAKLDYFSDYHINFMNHEKERKEYISNTNYAINSQFVKYWGDPSVKEAINEVVDNLF